MVDATSPLRSGSHPLPRIVPVFPLTGTLLLPGTLLPLNVFEERYRNLVVDALEESAILGLVQPITPALDNFGPVDDPDDPPALQGVGCLGKIDRAERQSDGRYHVLLRGLTRFRIASEEASRRGYRRVAIDTDEFGEDAIEIEAERNPTRVLLALRTFGDQHELEFDFDSLEGLSGVVLVNALSTALPFSPLEKQALLEAPDVAEREEVLLALMGMNSGEPPSPEERYSEPTIH